MQHDDRVVAPYGPPKTPAGYRKVPLAQGVLDVLAAHLAEVGADPHGLVFTTERGLPLSEQSFSTIWHEAVDPLVAKGLVPNGVTPHDLRHYCASLLIFGGCSVKEVQTVLGHESASVTMDTYAHWWPKSDDKVRDVVERAMFEELAVDSRSEHSAHG